MTISQGSNESLNLKSITWGDLTWFNIERPSRREMEYLAKNYPFHPLDLDDCLSRIQRAKIDEYEDYLFLIIPYSRWDKKVRVSTHEQVSVFIGAKYLITIHSGELKPLLKLFNECQAEEKTRQANFQYGSGYLLYRILDRTVDAYFPILDAILNWVDDIEDAVFDKNIKAAQEVATLRRDIITQRRIMLPWRSIIAELEAKLKRFSTRDNDERAIYFGDLLDHVNKICDSLEEAKEIVEVYKDTDSVLGTEQLGDILRVLTIVTTIATVLTALTSFYGMNIPLPGGANPGGNAYSWIYHLIAAIVVVGTMLFYFRRKRWI
ncbi:MAG: magnesium transporter CorA family protein [Chloroflexi bacterium]|nr:magnesium transporter CorA family protein [Chloroflexota bacterium]